MEAGMNGSNTGMNIPVKETEYSVATNRLSGNIGGLKDRLECLENRLTNILTPSNPQIRDGNKIEQSGTPLLRDIDSYSNKVIDLIIMVNMLIDRLVI